MIRHWVVYINKILWARKLTELGAQRMVRDLARLGKANVSYAYSIEEGN